MRRACILAALAALSGCSTPSQRSDSALSSATRATVQPSTPAPLQTVGPQSVQGRFGIGRRADPAEIAALDIDVMPDGRGLPPGRGTSSEGAPLFAAKCAACHGPEGQGPFVSPAGRLIGRNPGDAFNFATDTAGERDRTIGNYWPYATTLFDYVRRAMPPAAPGTLSSDEVYSVVAWVLAQNRIIPEGAVMNAETLPRVVMPARDRFVPDSRKGGREVK